MQFFVKHDEFFYYILLNLNLKEVLIYEKKKKNNVQEGEGGRINQTK
jgi:hypothetical protein